MTETSLITCEYILDEYLNVIETQKEAKLIEIINDLSKRDEKGSNTSCPPIRVFLLELSCRYIENRVLDDTIVKVLTEGKNVLSSFESVYADILWTLRISRVLCAMSIGSLISTTNQETELRTKYKSLLKLVVEKSICSRTILLERLDPEDIVPVIYQNRSEDMMRVINRYKRVNYYTQNNHISFYDQSEGYAQLLAALYNTSVEEDQFVSRICSIVGAFNLNQSRVLDIVLEAFEMNLSENRYYFALLDRFDRGSIPLLLVNRINHYMEPKQTIPKSFYMLLIILAANEYIKLEDFYSSFQYTEEMIRSDADQLNNQYLKASEEFFRVYLSNNVVRTTITPKRNPFVELFNAAASMGYLSLVLSLWTYLLQFKFNPCEFDDCTRSICSLLSTLLKPFYKSVAPQYSTHVFTDRKSSRKSYDNLNQTKPITTQEEFFSVIVPALFLLGPFIGKDHYLFTYICRILEYFVNSDVWKDPQYIPLFDKLYTAVLLPGLIFTQPTASLHCHLWNSFGHLSLYRRCSIYSHVLSETSSMNTQYHYALNEIIKVTDDYLNKLRKAGTETNVNKLLYYSMCSPFAVFLSVIKYIKGWSDDNKTINDHLENISSLSSDVLNYVLLSTLEGEQEKTNEDRTATTNAYTNYIQFASDYLYRYSYRFNYTLYFDYIKYKIDDMNCNALYLYDKLFTIIGNVYDISVKYGCQYDDKCYLPLLNGQLLNKYMLYKKELNKINDKNEKIFYSKLLRGNYILHFFIGISHLRHSFLYDADLSSPSVLVQLSDFCTNSLFQLSYLIKRYTESNKYFYDSIEDPFMYCTEYKVDLSMLFFMLRSVLKEYQLKHPEESYLVDSSNASSVQYLYFNQSNERMIFFDDLDKKKKEESEKTPEEEEEEEETPVAGSLSEAMEPEEGEIIVNEIEDVEMEKEEDEEDVEMEEGEENIEDVEMEEEGEEKSVNDKEEEEEKSTNDKEEGEEPANEKEETDAEEDEEKSPNDIEDDQVVEAPQADLSEQELKIQKWCCLSEPFLKSLLSILGTEQFRSISVYLYRWFWCLDYYDICDMNTCYEESLSELSLENSTKRHTLIEKVKEEQSSILASYQYFRPLLLQELSVFFSPSTNPYTGLFDFYKLCVLPRVMTSIEDSMFTAEFIRILYSNKTPNYDHIRFIRILPRIMLPLLQGCTKIEAVCIALFIRLMIAQMNIWYKNKDEFQEKYVENISIPASDTIKDGENEYDFNPIVSHTKFREMYQNLMNEFAHYILYLCQSPNIICLSNTFELIRKLSGVFRFRKTSLYNQVHSIISSYSKETSQYQNLISSASTALTELERMKP